MEQLLVNSVKSLGSRTKSLGTKLEQSADVAKTKIDAVQSAVQQGTQQASTLIGQGVNL
jgi:hypothetical protein